MSTTERRGQPGLTQYVPPIDDEPLDAMQQALVRMWVNVFVDEIRAELRAAEGCGDPVTPDEPGR